MAVVDPLPEEQIERDLLKQIQFCESSGLMTI